jgi:hypothetical protein
MKSKIRIATQTQTIQTLTKKMLSRNKYAFVSFPKATLLALGSSNKVSSDKKAISSSFIEEINKSFLIKDPAYMRAVPYSFVYSTNKDDELDPSIFEEDSVYFNSSTLENYYHSNEFVFNSFVQFYISNTPFIIVSFNDKKYIARLLGLPASHIQVHYNNFYDKINEICDSIDKVKEKSDTVILDCPILSSGLAHEIWNRFDLSILDLGKIVNFSKTKFLDGVKSNDKKTYKN